MNGDKSIVIDAKELGICATKKDTKAHENMENCRRNKGK